MPKYYGITHNVNNLPKHHREKCIKHNIHAFDEVVSSNVNNVMEHYLHCDACGLCVYIDKIEPRAKKHNPYYPTKGKRRFAG